MGLVRVAALAGALVLSGGAGYLSWAGVGRESGGLDRSVREGSAGNIINSSVK